MKSDTKFKWVCAVAGCAIFDGIGFVGGKLLDGMRWLIIAVIKSIRFCIEYWYVPVGIIVFIVVYLWLK